MRFLVLFLSLPALLCSALVIPDQEALQEDFFLADRADHLRISAQTGLERDDDRPPPDFGPRHQTLPTVLNETGLGHDLPQRLVVDIRDDKIRLNRHTKVLRHEIIATNGVLYHTKRVLIPPPTTQTLLNIPSHLSTFVLALSKTNLTDNLLPQFRTGGTTFAPTNHAFHKLGKRANRFLFSPEGEQCLRNLMQYHLVPNQTLYSDTLYDVNGQIQEFGTGGDVSVHVELPTLFQEQKLSVDITLRAAGAKLRVNGAHRVKRSDFLASDGVVHVLKRVLVPLKKVDWHDEQYVDHTDGGAMMEELKEQVAGCGGKGRLEL